VTSLVAGVDVDLETTSFASKPKSLVDVQQTEAMGDNLVELEKRKHRDRASVRVRICQRSQDLEFFAIDVEGFDRRSSFWSGHPEDYEAAATPQRIERRVEHTRNSCGLKGHIRSVSVRQVMDCHFCVGGVKDRGRAVSQCRGTTALVRLDDDQLCATRSAYQLRQYEADGARTVDNDVFGEFDSGAIEAVDATSKRFG